ncbi:MAG: glycoside hydrolase family 125 protein [Armatimonadota bacterium]|nr:glycoside hydrolase family 125 protein [Armatimonadota bacterium]
MRVINRLSTGNEFISIPDVLVLNAGIQDIGFVYEAFRACIELHGSEERPFLQPILEVNDRSFLEDGDLEWSRISYWIPKFALIKPPIKAEMHISAPPDRRGFVYAITVTNTSELPITVKIGWRGCWERTHHAANLSKLMVGMKHASISHYRPGVPVVEYRGHVPLFAVAFVADPPLKAKVAGESTDSEDSSKKPDYYCHAGPGKPLSYELTDEFLLEPNNIRDFALYVGIGLEEVSAIGSAEEMKLQGWKRLLASLQSWLDARTIEHEDEALKELANINSFYNYFYSQAVALDTEELTVVSARSAKNDACASYRDRDALLWSLPAVLQVNWSQARRMLLHGFTVQLSNVGVRSRYINGIVLEPGMQLDQLCAPIHALRHYVEVTGDMSVLFDRRVQHGINTIQQTLAALRHPKVQLFETLLLPSGRLSKLPYVCYSNVMVWRALKDLTWLYERIRDVDRSLEAEELAERIRITILGHFIVDGPFGKMFAQSVDLEGNHELGDDPSGSLLLLPFYEFCSADDPVYKHTAQWIRSELYSCSANDSDQASQSLDGSSGLSLVRIVNELLAGSKELASDFLRRAQLDDGIACEVVDPGTGTAIKGRAYASLGGYLAFGLTTALRMRLPATARVTQSRRPSEALYQPPPPEAGWVPKKARL